MREALIVAALRLLDAGGREPSLRAVARAAGVSAMAPYNHFADKTDLLAAVADRGFELMVGALAAADQRDDPREALVAQGIAFVDFAAAHPALFRLMYGESYGRATTGAVAATYAVLADRVAGLAPARRSAATLACRSLVQGLAMIVLNDRLAPSGPEDVAVAVRLLVAGLVAEAL